MPGEIIEIAPDIEPRSKTPAVAEAFADQYARVLAEQAIHDQQLQHGSHGLPSWLVFAAASGAVIALAIVYFLGR